MQKNDPFTGADSHLRGLPAEIAERRRRLFPIMSAPYMYQDPTNRDFRYTGRVVMDKLILNGKMYNVDTLS